MFLEQSLNGFPIKTELQEEAQRFVEATQNSYRIDVQLSPGENLYRGDLWHQASLDNTCFTGAVSNAATTLSASIPLAFLRELSDIGIEEHGVSAQEAIALQEKYGRLGIEIMVCPEQLQPVYDWVTIPEEPEDEEIMKTNESTIRENARIIRDVLDSDMKILNLIISSRYKAEYGLPHYISIAGYQIKKVPTDKPDEDATIMTVQIIDSNVGIIPLSIELLSFLIEKDTTYLLKKS